MANNVKKSRKKIIVFTAIAVVIIVLVLLIVLGSKKDPVISVQTEKVARRTITQSVTATGKIYPEVQVNITPEVSGEIVELPVREGQQVKKGDVVLRIKQDFYLALRDQAAAGLASARANLLKSESDYIRVRGLFEKGLVSESERDQARASFEVAKAQHDQAEANLKQAEENLRKTTIYSPMDGTVSQLKVELGERVLGTSQFQGTHVMTIADLSRMEARVDVGENDVVLISIGDTARVEVDAFPNRKFNGMVYEIANTATTRGLGTQEEVTNFQVKIRILDRDVAFRPGMSMTATIETETKQNVIAVPIQSITTRAPKEERSKEQSGSSDQASSDAATKKESKMREVVFIVENNTARSVPVKRGISDASYVEILEGLEEGMEVISGGFKAISRELEDGSKVRIEKPADKK
jgi:HlyD family secretion protein